ncbi:hypothetical protein SAMN05444678_12337 [Sphingomonas sp. YR710]|uniref:hypothetical protein n=1 Tax=Sphingomonas sp. YR710 TaxID=1882773 RepID=UPI0008887819|nr:hypothetical protein [Sphingomonas sp. YR710]SDD81056.1 hypothetical protein SAMN05444678_12337 [Sphingomonas sp. YR710]
MARIINSSLAAAATYHLLPVKRSEAELPQVAKVRHELTANRRLCPCHPKSTGASNGG